MTFKITSGPNGPILKPGVIMRPLFNLGEPFPVENSLLQWYISAEDQNIGTVTSPNEIVISDKYSNVSISSNGRFWSTPSVAIPVISFTNNYGKVIKYFQLGSSTNLRTTNSSYSYSTIVSNAGYTIWSVSLNTVAHNYKRTLWYAATDNPLNVAGTGNPQFGNITNFLHTNNGFNEYRWGFYNDTSTNSGFITQTNNTFQYQANKVLIRCFSFKNLTSTNFLYTSLNYAYDGLSSALQNFGNSIDVSLINQSTFSLNNTALARPYIQDNIYGGDQSSTFNLMEMGFANRPFTATELTTQLFPWLQNKYLN